MLERTDAVVVPLHIAVLGPHFEHTAAVVEANEKVRPRVGVAVDVDCVFPAEPGLLRYALGEKAGSPLSVGPHPGWLATIERQPDIAVARVPELHDQPITRNYAGIVGIAQVEAAPPLTIARAAPDDNRRAILPRLGGRGGSPGRVEAAVAIEMRIGKQHMSARMR